MLLSPSERVQIISEISRRLSSEDWSLVDLTLSQFGIPVTDDWQGNIYEYVMQMSSQANDETLISLSHHVGFEISTLQAKFIPPFWNSSNLRVFLSHLSIHREFAHNLQVAMESYGISVFVAHTDIEPTTQWLDEIETALSTCEVLIALLHDGFKDSDWTDQEVGFAMGRGIPVFSIRFDQVPYGLIGRLQAFNGNQKTPETLAREVFDMLRQHKQTQRRMVEILVARFESSSSFKSAKENIRLLEELEFWSHSYSERILDAAKQNSQIRDSWGVPSRVKNLVEAWSQKGV